MCLGFFFSFFMKDNTSLCDTFYFFEKKKKQKVIKEIRYSVLINTKNLTSIFSERELESLGKCVWNKHHHLRKSNYSKIR